MRELAESCGVSVPTLYNTFGGKQELLLEALQSYTRAASLTRALDAAGGSGHERLLQLVRIWGEDVRMRPEHHRRLVALVLHQESARGLSSHMASQIFNEARVALEQMVAAGTLEDWVQPPALAQRVASNGVMVSMEWADRTELSPESWYAAMAYATATLMLGVSREPARGVFLKCARDNQQSAAAVGFVRAEDT